ncbi:uncharacterized protein LOC119359763 [Triticum dicoccoides]|uniref:uncharacterized protein LOC119359763 n=1 Tax=Triticum dicoccoides TaxID=85692 RepID=UPI0018902581|nr:uncharacterized protein LOC119359763 [Triticum dicoccoides]
MAARGRQIRHRRCSFGRGSRRPRAPLHHHSWTLVRLASPSKRRKQLFIHRQLWIWIHLAALDEGLDGIRIASSRDRAGLDWVFGVLFSFLRILMLFDKGFLAMGNVLFVSGVPLTIGLKSTFQFFTKPKNRKVIYM